MSLAGNKDRGDARRGRSSRRPIQGHLPDVPWRMRNDCGDGGRHRAPRHRRQTNPINEGKLCSKAGTASIEQLYHPDRLDYPLLRQGERGEGKWKRISWDEAMTRIAEKMNAAKAECGAESVAFGRGTGVNNPHVVSRLANLFGTPNVISIG